MGDTADDEAANDWSPRAPMTNAVAARTVDRVGLLLVLARCRSYLQSTQRDVARAYLVFDTPTICAGAEHREERACAHGPRGVLGDHGGSATGFVGRPKETGTDGYRSGLLASFSGRSDNRLDKYIFGDRAH
jgi:hypothetical protein